MPLPECTRLDIDAIPSDWTLAEGREIEVLEHWRGVVTDDIGRVKAREIADLVAIALTSYTEDRLHRDPNVHKALADASKAKWVVDACNDPARTVLVYRMPDPVAFISFFSRGSYIDIDLLAVGEHYRGKGIAKKLILRACAMADVREVLAGTQSTNEAAKKLYSSLGMQVRRRERTFHRP